MATPQKSKTTPYANSANDLSITFAHILPGSAGDVANFLHDAAYAFGEREADLARALGISRATMSGWKGRGAIPAVHLKWFEDEFMIAILSGTTARQHEGWRHAGIPAVLHLFKSTDFNPFAIKGLAEGDKINLCFSYLGELSRLALFVQNRLGVREGDTPGDEEARTALALAALVAPLARRLPIRSLVSQPVSQ